MKKKILLLSDDIRMHSGISTMARELVMGTVDKYDWVNLGGALQHPEEGKRIDMSQAVQGLSKVKDANVIIYPTTGYGNEQLIDIIMDNEKPDALVHFTDPKYWTWLYAIEKKIRKRIPLTYLTIWDDLPYPMWNKPFYESCDSLFAISRQTKNIVENVLGKHNCFDLPVESIDLSGPKLTPEEAELETWKKKLNIV